MNMRVCIHVHSVNKCHSGIVKVVMDKFPLCQKHAKAIITSSLCHNPAQLRITAY